MLSLIFLAYNDGKSLQEILPDWIHVLESISDKYEIIIADDGSYENTADMVSEITSTHPTVKYVRSSCNKGVGANFRMGIEHAGGNYIAYTDGDGQYLPADLLALWQELGNNDMVTGERTRRAGPFTRTLASALYNRFVKMIYPLRVNDINSGLKIYNRAYIEHCSPQVSDGPFFDAEYLIKGYAQGMKIKEIPIHHRKRKYGSAAGVSRKSIKFLFSEICNKNMSVYVHKNYFARLIFRLLTIQAS